MSTQQTDLTRPPDLTHERRLRTHRPVYVDLMPPCNDACPAGEDIQSWLALARAGHLEAAWRRLVRDNPMPSIHGRVCYHPCETSCNRTHLDAAVSIHAVERFLGDRARAEGWQIGCDAPPSGKRVLVVGAGPSGLSAAYHLARRGHAVEVHEAGPVAGGMMVFGIPSYRLPREILASEIRFIESVGVRIVLDHKVEDLLTEMRAGRFDAAFLAVGAHLARRTAIPACDAGKLLDAVSFLRSVSTGETPQLGRRVAVYGGGDTAMDAARVARRLGHEPLIIYRRDREHMPAQPAETLEALEEGVKVHWLRSIRAMDQGELQIEVMELDPSGRPRPTGRFETLEADSLILALGQDVESRFLERVPGVAFLADGTVMVGEDLQTGHPGIFAGGDMVPAERTVTTAVGHGKRAARHIDAYLRGEAPGPRPRPPVVRYEQLHLWYSTEAAHRPEQRIDLERRLSTFGEVVEGLSEANALFEARRCLSCGNCCECDGCFGACPEGAIRKLGAGKRYAIDHDRCTGCAVCFEQCPCGAIEMVPERAP